MSTKSIFNMDAGELREWLAEAYQYELVSPPMATRMWRAVRQCARLTGMTTDAVINRALEDGALLAG